MTRPDRREFGLSIVPDDRFARATLPLFEDGIVDVVEWSPDLGWRAERPPEWVDALVDDYADDGALLGHGVSFSVLGARFTDRQRLWLEHLRREVRRRPYRHFSEHIGSLGAGRFSFTAPLPAPVDDDLVRVGRDRVARLSEAAGMPIGLENLATSLGRADGVDQPGLVEALVTPVGGFVILDVHNLWSQAVNLGLDPLAELDRYPLDLVREIHVSGGSWSATANPSRRLRRDTHDGVVPEPVVELLTEALDRCPDAVTVYERLARGLDDDVECSAYQTDVRRVAALVHSRSTDPAPPLAAHRDVPPPPDTAAESVRLARYQAGLVDVLDRERSADDITRKAALWAVQTDSDHAVHVEAMDPALLGVAAELVATWGQLMPTSG